MKPPAGFVPFVSSVVICVAAGSAAAQVRTTTVALSGRPAPGAEAGAAFKSFQDPMLGSDGTVTFGASLNGAASNADTGLWLGTPGNLQVVAREGQAAPGLAAGVKFDDFTFGFNPLIVNASGQVAMTGSVTGGGAFGRAIWAGTPQGLQLVAREFTNTPGSTGQEMYLGLRNPDLNDAGRVAFTSALTVQGDSRRLEGVFTGFSGALARAARSADSAVGTSERFIAFGEPRLSASGQTLFAARILDPLGSRGDHGLWATSAEAPTAPVLVVREANPAPGMAAGITLGNIAVTQAQFNRAGQLLFPAPLEGAVTAADDAALFFGTTRTLRPILRAGDGAPGVSPGAVFDSLNVGTFLHDNGRFAFASQLRSVDTPTAPTRASLWSGVGTSLVPVAIGGDVAPGTSDRFSAFPGAPLVNAGGEVAFTAILDVAGSDARPNGIWMGTPGDLHLVALEGRPFDVGGGELKTVSRVDLVERPDQLRYVLNDQGQLRFMAFFTDGTSGVFLATVPEPGGAALVLAALLPLVRRRRR